MFSEEKLVLFDDIQNVFRGKVNKLQQCTTFRVFLLRSYAQHASCHVVSFENELISMMCYFTFLVERVRDGLHFL